LVALKKMKAYAHLKPGQNGTRRLQEKYGAALLCVRYWYDEIRNVKLKTVEIIVDEKPLRHPQYGNLLITSYAREVNDG